LGGNPAKDILQPQGVERMAHSRRNGGNCRHLQVKLL